MFPIFISSELAIYWIFIVRSFKYILNVPTPPSTVWSKTPNDICMQLKTYVYYWYDIAYLILTNTKESTK